MLAAAVAGTSLPLAVALVVVTGDSSSSSPLVPPMLTTWVMVVTVGVLGITVGMMEKLVTGLTLTPCRLKAVRLDFLVLVRRPPCGPVKMLATVHGGMAAAAVAVPPVAPRVVVAGLPVVCLTVPTV